MALPNPDPQVCDEDEIWALETERWCVPWKLARAIRTYIRNLGYMTLRSCSYVVALVVGIVAGAIVSVMLVITDFLSTLAGYTFDPLRLIPCTWHWRNRGEDDTVQ